MYRKVMLYTSKDWEKNIFSDDITFITLSKTSDLLLRKSTNLNNNPRMRFINQMLISCNYILCDFLQKSI